MPDDTTEVGDSTPIPEGDSYAEAYGDAAPSGGPGTSPPEDESFGNNTVVASAAQVAAQAARTARPEEPKKPRPAPRPAQPQSPELGNKTVVASAAEAAVAAARTARAGAPRQSPPRPAAPPPEPEPEVGGNTVVASASQMEAQAARTARPEQLIGEEPEGADTMVGGRAAPARPAPELGGARNTAVGAAASSPAVDPEATVRASPEVEASGGDRFIGKVIDGCKIVKKLGQGGMGVVYRADEEDTGDKYVLKILNPALVGAEDTVERFFREAQACAQLNHPGIVAIHNVGQDTDVYFIRMEFVDGETLEDLVKSATQLDWREATQLVIDAAEALAHAHAKGMIHRDIKPENIMRTRDGVLKVMDFGLAKHVHSNAKVSVTGQIVGTPFFMSPEQAGGKPTDARSDIYSLGVTLYYMVTGVKPFNGKNLQEIFLKHFFYAPESPKIYNPELPDALCEVVRRCLKKKKKERYQSARALIRDLTAVLTNPGAALPAAGEAAEGGDDGGPRGPDDEAGHTVRVTPAAAGGGPEDEDAGKTVRAGVAPPAGGGSGARADDDDDGGATVAVRQPVFREPGEVSGVSFRGSQIFGGGDGNDATVKFDVAAGPAPGAAPVHPDSAPELQPEPAAPAPGPGRKKAAIVVSAVLLVLILAYGGYEMVADSAYQTLVARYEGLAQPTPEAYSDLETEFQLLAQSYSFASAAQKSLDMATRCRELAQGLQARREQEAREREEERKRKEEALRQTELRRQLRVRAMADRSRLDQLKGSRDWPAYTDLALRMLAEPDFSLVPEALQGIQIPVLVTSKPAGATVTLGGQGPGVPTPAELWVDPQAEFTIQVSHPGFETQERAGVGAQLSRFHVELARKVLRRLSLGSIRIKIGNRDVEEAVVPMHDPRLDLQGDGTAFFVGHDGLLRAIDLKTGAARWRQGGSEAAQVGLYGDPTPAPEVVPGRAVLTASLTGKVQAIAQDSAALIWERELSYPVSSSPRYASSVIVVGTTEGKVHFLGEENGDVRWSFPTENAVVATPLLQGDRAYVGSTDNRVYALDWRARRLLGKLDLGEDVVIGPRWVGRRLVVGTRGGRLHVIDAADPANLTRVATFGEREASGAIQGLEVVGPNVYFSAGNTLWAVEVRGKEAVPAWSEPFRAAAPLTRPAVSGDDLLFVGSGRTLYALDRTTGAVRWEYQLPGAMTITHAPIVVDTELYLIAGDQVLVLAVN